MVVVGKGKYINTQESYPLDKKTLRKIALRSFFVRSAFNGETGESIGWTWALMPGLEKIHTDKEDLALSLGHNLEYVNTGSFFSTFAMGVVLSLEQQKADLETIRSVRTMVAALTNGISKVLYLSLLFPLFSVMFINVENEANVILPIVFFAVFACLSVVLRFVGMMYGYSQGTKVVEKYMRHKDALTHAARIMGVFMIGVLMVMVSQMVDPISSVNSSTISSGLTTAIVQLLNNVLPGVVGVVITLWMYHLLTKKNYSLAKCFIILLLIGVIGGFLGLYSGITTTILPLPWM